MLPSTAELLSGASTMTGGPSLPVGLRGVEGLLIRPSKSCTDGLLESPDFRRYTIRLMLKSVLVFLLYNVNHI